MTGNRWELKTVKLSRATRKMRYCHFPLCWSNEFSGDGESTLEWPDDWPKCQHRSI